MNTREIILNDSLSELTKLYQNLQQKNPQIIFDTIYNIIDEFKLSNTAKYGYEFYHCDSTKGSSSYNKKPFLVLRNRYKQTKILFAYLF